MTTKSQHRVKVTALINDITLGGAQSVLLNIASLINKEQFVFSVCYLNDYASEGGPDLLSAFHDTGTSVTNLGKGKKLSLFHAFFKLIPFLWRDRPDVLHCCLPDSVIAGVFAGRLLGVNKIIIHEMNTHNFYSKKLEFLFRIARRFADLTITYSETLETELVGDYEVLQKPVSSIRRKSYTIYNGINLALVDETRKKVSRDEKRKELGINPEDILIFSAARLIGWKGFEFLIRAAPKVIGSCKHARILIAGGGEQETFLQNLIEELSLAPYVRLLGARTDVYEILAVSDIYPQAYAYPEGFSSISISMSGMEAMAFGLPIIASRYPALYEQIEHEENALIVEPRDIDGIAEALLALSRSRDSRERIGENARHFVEEYFSSAKTVKIYESIYEGLLEQGATKGWKT